MYQVGTCRAPDNSYYLRSTEKQEIPAKKTYIDLGHAHNTGS